MRLPSLRIKIFGAITTVLLLLVGCALTVPLASADDAACGPALSTSQLNGLLDQYAKSYETKDNYWKISEQISDAIFCLGKSPVYISDLKLIESRATGANPTPYLDLARSLQNDWETRYLLKVTNVRRTRENLAAEGANSLLLVTMTLGFFNVPNHVSNYFGLFRQLIPVLIPSAATLTAKALNTKSLLDNAYPLAPAHVMTELKVPQQESTYNSYDVLRTVVGATTSVAAAQIATSLISYYAVGMVTVGSMTFNPLTIAASLALSQAGKYAGTKAVDEYEFISLKNDLIREEEGIICALANGDMNEAHSLSDEFYKTVIQLSSSLDLREIDAWDDYQKGIAEANAPRHIPFIDEKSTAHAKEVYDKKMAEIEADRDPKAADEVQLYTVLSLIGDSPTEVASLTPAQAATADALLDQFEGYKNTHGDHYQEFIQSQIDSQNQRLSDALHSGKVIKDSQYLLLEAVAFLQTQNSPVLNGAKKDLLHLLNTGIVVEMQ